MPNFWLVIKRLDISVYIIIPSSSFIEPSWVVDVQFRSEHAILFIPKCNGVAYKDSNSAGTAVTFQEHFVKEHKEPLNLKYIGNMSSLKCAELFTLFRVVLYFVCLAKVINATFEIT